MSELSKPTRLQQAVETARAAAEVGDNPKERLVFWSSRHNMGAVVDPFFPARCAVVACLGEAVAEGEQAHIGELPYSRAMVFSVGLQAVRGAMVDVARQEGDQVVAVTQDGATSYMTVDEAGGERVLAQEAGFQQPRQPHVVFSVGVRREEPLHPMGQRTTEVTLDRYWQLMQSHFEGDALADLEFRMDAVAAIGTALDQPRSDAAYALLENMAAPLG